MFRATGCYYFNSLFYAIVKQPILLHDSFNILKRLQIPFLLLSVYIVSLILEPTITFEQYHASFFTPILSSHRKVSEKSSGTFLGEKISAPILFSSLMEGNICTSQTFTSSLYNGANGLHPRSILLVPLTSPM